MIKYRFVYWQMQIDSIRFAFIIERNVGNNLSYLYVGTGGRGLDERPFLTLENMWLRICGYFKNISIIVKEVEEEWASEETLEMIQIFL